MRSEHGLAQMVDQLTRLAVTSTPDGRPPSLDRDRSETIQRLAGQVKEMSLDGQSLERLVFAPLAEGLVTRWGVEDDLHLFRQIVNAFRDHATSVALMR